MEIVISILAGFIFACGVYLILQKRLLRIVFGTVLISHGAHLFIITMGKLERGSAPVIEEGKNTYVDPLPQALILTSIVISFGVTAFIAVLAYRVHQSNQTDNIDELRGNNDE